MTNVILASVTFLSTTYAIGMAFIARAKDRDDNWWFAGAAVNAIAFGYNLAKLLHL